MIGSEREQWRSCCYAPAEMVDCGQLSRRWARRYRSTCLHKWDGWQELRDAVEPGSRHAPLNVMVRSTNVSRA